MTNTMKSPLTLRQACEEILGQKLYQVLLDSGACRPEIARLAAEDCFLRNINSIATSTIRNALNVAKDTGTLPEEVDL